MQGLAGKIRFKKVLDSRRKEHHAEEAIHHRGNARKQFHRRLKNPVDGGRGKAGHIDRGEQADGHPHHQRAGGDIDGAENHRQNAVDVVSGFPGRTKQEAERSDLRNGRQTVGKQERADQRDRKDGDAGAGRKDDAHGLFSYSGRGQVPHRIDGGAACSFPALCLFIHFLYLNVQARGQRGFYSTSFQTVVSPT